MYFCKLCAIRDAPLLVAPLHECLWVCYFLHFASQLLSAFEPRQGLFFYFRVSSKTRVTYSGVQWPLLIWGWRKGHLWRDSFQCPQMHLPMGRNCGQGGQHQSPAYSAKTKFVILQKTAVLRLDLYKRLCSSSLTGSGDFLIRKSLKCVLNRMWQWLKTGICPMHFLRVKLSTN